MANYFYVVNLDIFNYIVNKRRGWVFTPVLQTFHKINLIVPFIGFGALPIWDLANACADKNRNCTNN